MLTLFWSQGRPLQGCHCKYREQLKPVENKLCVSPETFSFGFSVKNLRFEIANSHSVALEVNGPKSFYRSNQTRLNQPVCLTGILDQH